MITLFVADGRAAGQSILITGFTLERLVFHLQALRVEFLTKAIFAVDSSECRDEITCSTVVRPVDSLLSPCKLANLAETVP